VKRLLFLICLPLHAMQVTSSSPQSPTKKPLSPKEIATVVSVRLFDRPDDEVISAFTRIITRDPKGNTALLELRYRMISHLEEEHYTCGETH
jgi:hypothetical protein